MQKFCSRTSAVIRTVIRKEVNRKWFSIAADEIRRYNPASNYIDEIKTLLGKSDEVLTGKEDIEQYITDWTQYYKGGTIVCLPRTTASVSKLLKFCNDKKIGIVPQGGNTGLVGGAVGTGDQVVLSLKRLNKVLSIDSSSGVLTCEAGCILEHLDQEVRKLGFIVPLDLGAKGSCYIGGNVATNAGGLRVIRYGSIHRNLLGLEVVKADGTVLNMMRPLPKDNTGYNLKNLFVGSEGTLGVITKVSIALAPAPTATAVGIARVASFDVLPRLLQRTRAQTNDILSAFEFFDAYSIDAVKRTSPQLIEGIQSSIFPAEPSDPSQSSLKEKGIGSVSVLIECSATGDQGGVSMAQRMETLLGSLFEEGLIEDAAISQDTAQEQEMWSVREHISPCLMQLSRMTPNGKLFKYDVSVALAQTSQLVENIKSKLAMERFRIKGYEGNIGDAADPLDGRQLLVCNFGHCGDQNLHLNVVLEGRAGLDKDAADRHLEVAKEAIDRVVYGEVIALSGSVSAEHGIGQQKRKILAMARSPAELQMMSAIKDAFDPNRILNPGKVIPDGY